MRIIFTPLLCLAVCLSSHDTRASDPANLTRTTHLANAVASHGVGMLLSQVDPLCRRNMSAYMATLTEICVYHVLRSYRTMQLYVWPITSDVSDVVGFIYAKNISIGACYNVDLVLFDIDGCFNIFIRRVMFQVIVQANATGNLKVVMLKLFMEPPEVRTASGYPGRWVLDNVVYSLYGFVLSIAERLLKDMFNKEINKLNDAEDIHKFIKLD